MKRLLLTSLFVFSFFALPAFATDNDIPTGTANGDRTLLSAYDSTFSGGNYRNLLIVEANGANTKMSLDPARTFFTGNAAALGTRLSALEGVGSTAADISDSTGTGRAVLTAPDESAARSAIGAGVSNFDGLWTSLDARPETFPPETHTHTAVQLSDSTTVGRAVLTAGTQAAARSAIGAGTSSFDGAYSSLTGIPSTFTPSTHNHDDRYYTETEMDAALSGKAATSTVIGTGASINNGATNAATNLTASSVDILGITVPTNASYTSLVSAHNDLATKYNDLATKYNTLLNMLEARNVPAAN